MASFHITGALVRPLRTAAAVAATLSLLFAGCQGSTAPPRVTGSWDPHTVDGEPLPHVVGSLSGYPIRLVSGQLYIADDGTLANLIQLSSWAGPEAAIFPARYTSRPGGVRFHFDDWGWGGGGYTETAVLRGGDLVVEGRWGTLGAGCGEKR